MNKKLDLASLKEQLDSQTDFPTLYMFKFIVPIGKENEVAKLLPRNELVLKKSAKGNYASVTIKAMMPSSDSIIAVYEQASAIEGIISL
jgi:putative lipoic acid-binding regulatory protein